VDVEIYLVSFDQFAAMVGDREDRHVVLSAAKLCAEIIVALFDGEPLVYLGLAPTTLISSEVYVWMIVTEEGQKHPFLIGRYAKKTLETILLKYPLIYGDCFSEKSARWLRSLGAVFTAETKFEFRRN
jgi:hypothetical protein